MTEARVWAPYAERVEVVGDGERIALSPVGDGWFSGDHPFVDYMFSLDGGEPRPDPRSGWQPNGVHGASRVVDHHSFTWTDGAWSGSDLGNAVIYELHVGTFTS